MRRSGTRQSRSLKVSLVSTFLSVCLLLPIVPMSALGQTKPATKAPPSGTKRTPSATAKKPQKKSDDMAWLEAALKDPEFMKAFAHFTDRLTAELQMPAPRTQSHILPRLSDGTMFYAAFPNYGPVLRQFLQILQQELHDSPALRNFVQKNKLESGESKFEEMAQKVSELLDYLGDEVVVTAAVKGREPSGVLVAEVRKPGLSGFLDHLDTLINEDAKSKEHLRVFDPQTLQTATDAPGGGPVVLVRPDFLVIGTSAATVRDFNAQLDKGPGTFAANALGKRLAQSYQSGTSTVFAADLQKLMGLIPQNSPSTAQIKMLLDKSGFADAKYALMESRGAGRNSSNEVEVMFNGPRRGVASWIAPSGTLGSLDFMSPKSAVVEAFRLKPPAQILDDIVEIAGPMALQALPQIEQQFNVNLKQDILNKLGGEIGFELQMPVMPEAGSDTNNTKVQGGNFAVALSVTDAPGLQQTIKRLMAQSPIPAQERVEDGITFYSVAPPSAGASGQEFNYFFQDGYLIVTSNRELARETINLHRNGGSVAKLQGQPVKASGFARQNSNMFFASMLRQLPPDVSANLPKAFSGSEPMLNTMYAYADENSIRATSNSSMQTNAAMGLIVAAVAIPNLLRSKMAANDAAAVSILRTVNTAEVTYYTSYPKKGYAPSLAVMGPGAAGDCSNPTAANACLLDQTLGDPSCTGGKWCIKSGYKFSVRGICTPAGHCSGYAATATPVNPGSTGTKSFCTTTDAVIRSHEGGVDAPLTSAACRAWQPI
jgi:type IV pilus assembly protein PilA